MLKTILSISGKPGLYKLVSHGKNMLIVESLTDNKRVPAYAKDKVISLGDIAIYTDETEVPLHEVLTSVKNKEEGKTASLVPSKATTDQLRAYFAEVLPSYDRERVYPSDIKKLLSWYNILINAGITDFTPDIRHFFRLFLLLKKKQLGFQHLHCLIFVHMLRTLILTLYHNSCRKMCNTDCR